MLLWHSQFTRPLFNRSLLLDDYGAHLVVRSIGIYAEWWLWLRNAMRISKARIIFMIWMLLSISGVQQKVFLPDLSDSGYNKWSHLGHMSRYVFSAPRKPHISLTLGGGSCSRIAEMCFFHGLRPVKVNQYPSQLVSWIDHAQLRGLTEKPFALRQDKTLSRRTWCSYYVFLKILMLSR